MAFTNEERNYLLTHSLGRIATASAAGQPDVAAVTYRLDEADRFVIGGMDNPKTLKWRNILGSKRAAFVVDDLASVDPWRPRGVKVHGSASADTDPDGSKVIRITPEIVWSWGINPPETPKHFGGMVERRHAHEHQR